MTFNAKMTAIILASIAFAALLPMFVINFKREGDKSPIFLPSDVLVDDSARTGKVYRTYEKDKALRAETGFTQFVYWKNGTFAVARGEDVDIKRVFLNPNSAKATEYVRMAKSKPGGLYVPDDAIPIVEIRGECAVVTFWDSGWVDGASSIGYYAEVFIEIRTKTVLGVVGPAD